MAPEIGHGRGNYALGRKALHQAPDRKPEYSLAFLFGGSLD